MDFNDTSPPVDDGDTAQSPRKRSRDSLFLMANIRIKGSPGIMAVRVRNLSEGGLMADLSELLASDTAVEVEVRGIGWVPGRVAWQAENRAGIAFDTPIDPQKARKPVGGGTTTPFYTKAIVTRR